MPQFIRICDTMPHPCKTLKNNILRVKFLYINALKGVRIICDILPQPFKALLINALTALNRPVKGF